jgi:hypothetical protein
MIRLRPEPPANEPVCERTSAAVKSALESLPDSPTVSGTKKTKERANA